VLEWDLLDYVELKANYLVLICFVWTWGCLVVSVEG
jgi:hypothetical protein